MTGVYRALRTRIMHGEVGPGQAMTLRGSRGGIRRLDDAGA